MTRVRQPTPRNAYVYENRVDTSTYHKLGNETRLGETSRGGIDRPFVPTQCFSRLRRKPIAPRLAVGLRKRADAAGRWADSSPHSMTGDTQNHLYLDLDATSRWIGSLSTPFVVGCASSTPLFYTPHEQGLCWLRLRGRTTYHSEYLSWLTPRERVHRSSLQRRSPGVGK